MESFHQGPPATDLSDSSPRKLHQCLLGLPCLTPPHFGTASTFNWRHVFNQWRLKEVYRQLAHLVMQDTWATKSDNNSF